MMYPSFVQTVDNLGIEANRLMTIFSHLRSRPKIVITRDLGPEASALITSKDSYEVDFDESLGVAATTT